MFTFSETNTFCINLDRRPDRWETIQNVFKETGLSVTRWRASEPKDVLDTIQGSPTQQACSQSHLRIWRHIIENNIKYALIMEDDITFDKEWREKLKAFKKPYDLLMLNTDHYYSVNEWSHTNGESWLTGAYILTKRCAEKLIEIGKKIGHFLPSDHMLLCFQKETQNKNCYSYFPYLAIQTSKDSDIAGSIPEFSYTRTINELKDHHYSLSNYIGMEDHLFLYPNAFWKGFVERTDPVHIDFFLQLFSKVFHKRVVLGTFQNSDILLESFFGNQLLVKAKLWKYSFFFSGESQQRYPVPDYFKDIYTAILRSKFNDKNIINVPEFMSYIYSSNLVEKLAYPKRVEKVPPKHTVVIISNGTSAERNFLLDHLESRLGVDKIEYRGPYRNNAPVIDAKYNTDEFYNEISQYKFIITLENSRDETYVTEKITHGLIAGNIPVYWGSEYVKEHFNSERFLYLNQLDEQSINETIGRMIELSKDHDAYLEMVNKPILQKEISLDAIAEEIRKFV
jgi:glycosyl transferase family 25